MILYTAETTKDSRVLQASEEDWQRLDVALASDRNQRPLFAAFRSVTRSGPDRARRASFTLAIAAALIEYARGIG